MSCNRDDERKAAQEPTPEQLAIRDAIVKDMRLMPGPDFGTPALSERLASREIRDAHEELDRRGIPKTRIVADGIGAGSKAQAITLGLTERIKLCPIHHPETLRGMHDTPTIGVDFAAGKDWTVIRCADCAFETDNIEEALKHATAHGYIELMLGGRW